MSRIYVPQRVLGLVSNGVPSIIQTRGKEHFLTTCIGKSLNTYSCNKLHLIFVSTQLEDDITRITFHKDYIIAIALNRIYAFIRGKLVRSFDGHDSNITEVLAFGNCIVSTSENKRLLVHDIEAGELYAEGDLTCCASAILHPATYLNKILIGSKEGILELWNIRTMKLVYQFAKFDSEITALAQSTGVDVVAVGFLDGKIKLHNIKYDETLFSFHQDWGCVATLSFRTDGTPHMVSCGTEGHIAVWDLEKQELHSTLHHAHLANVSAAHFFTSQPLLVTTSSDNSIKMWVFDGAGGTARLLKERSGHHGPPTIVKFYGSNYETVLSGGRDKSLRLFCVIKDERSRELSQGSLESKSKKINVAMDDLKLSPITTLAAEEIREREWCNVITAHVGDKAVRMWSTHNISLSQKSLLPKLGTIVVTAVAITTCGNIGVVGYNSGHLTAFNLQSGINRGLFGSRLAHKLAITGVATDNINRYVISCSKDASLKIWDLQSRKLVNNIKMENSVTKFILHRESNLISCVMVNHSIHLVDIDTLNVVRKFSVSATVTDISFSMDGKWLVAASTDNSVRIWDLMTSQLIDYFKTVDMVTSLSLSPDQLVTTHLNKLGLCSWYNKSLYENIELKPISKDYIPVVVGKSVIDECEDNAMDVNDDIPFKSLDQINSDLISISSSGKNKWVALCNLDTIRKRNKPKEAPKKPIAAPFFLGTTKELVPKFVVAENSDKDNEPMKAVKREAESEFQAMLLSNYENSEKVLELLESMASSAIDIELQSLSPVDGGSLELVISFAKFIIAALKSKKNYDLVQAYLNVFLKHNRKYLMENKDLADLLSELHALHEDSWKQLQHEIQTCFCISQFIKSATL